VARGDEVFDAADIEPAETSDAENVIHDLSGRVERVDAQLLLCGGVDDAVVELVARVHLADVRGAEVEVPPGAICDSERVEVFATQEFHSAARAVLALEELLHQPRPIGTEIELGRVGRERLGRIEAAYVRARSADVGFHDHREAQLAGGAWHLCRVGDHARRGRSDGAPTRSSAANTGAIQASFSYRIAIGRIHFRG